MGDVTLALAGVEERMTQLCGACEEPILWAPSGILLWRWVHQLQYIFKRVASRCGLQNKDSPHKMRHSLAAVLLNQGVPLVAVQSSLGHEQPETTQLYACLIGTARQQAYIPIYS